MNLNIRIVLVNPSHPGNIGAVARAMKTMDLSNLYLVNPKSFPHVDATARAAGADDILASAVITSSLVDALKESRLVFGTSSRLRALSLPTLNPREAAQLIVKESQSHTTSIVFGRENNGLSNEELELCNYQIHIPTNPDFYSLNLAAAAQLIAYEIKMATQHCAPATTAGEPDLASAEEQQLFYLHLQQLLAEIKFLDLKNPRKVLSRLKLLFNRAQPQKNEINILRGILTAIQSKIR
ncbi:MAG: RNA methyltransferase TrmH, group 1 [uncultured bacterium]|nr:MAG: RNA methyltransferase TrmH, group 1 [uncultured bacterium]